jgi:predicted aldo/keto reductase-like oxidoreductase
MEKRKIASLNAEVSLLGFGFMRLPVDINDKSKIDYPKAQAMVDRAYKAGVNYFDTAWPYHGKMSEVFAGDTLSKYPRESYYLATKMPTWEPFTSEADVERIFEEQLRKCKTGYFDFYLAHSMSEDRMDVLRDKIYGYLSRMKEQGKIRHLGFSFHDNPALLKELVKSYKWDFAQIQLNYLDWETADAKSLYEILTEHNLPVVIMEPIKGGALANLNEKTLSILKKADPGASPASWALRFAASLPNVMTVLSGMTEPSQVEDNLKTFGTFRPISDAERKVLYEAATVFHSSGTIPCTGCRYCMDCPSGVEIPRILAQYNYYLLTQNRINYNNQYRTLKKSEQAHNCISCGKCEKLCPQQIVIHKYMEEVKNHFEKQ